MTLEEMISNVSKNYPDPMTQAEFGAAVGLGYSSTAKLLKTGVLPFEEVCEQLVHYHMIRKSDVIRYLEDRFAHASQTYIEAGKRCVAMMLWDEPEILSMKDIMRVTGVRKDSAQKWLRSGKLRSFEYFNRTIVRKIDLIEFMASPAYQDSSHKNIRAQAVTLAVEWYAKASAKKI